MNNVVWGQHVERCLRSLDPAQDLKLLQHRCSVELADLTALVRAELSALTRKAVVALITIDVHNRDVVGTLMTEGCTSAASFSWQMQLRCARCLHKFLQGGTREGIVLVCVAVIDNGISVLETGMNTKCMICS